MQNLKKHCNDNNLNALYTLLIEKNGTLPRTWHLTTILVSVRIKYLGVIIRF